MRSTRRGFLRSTSGGVLLLSRRLRADDDMPSGSADDALSMFIQVWNQFGDSNSPDFGTNWTSDPGAAALVANAYSMLSGAWASNGADLLVQNALDNGAFALDLMTLIVPERAFEQLIQRGAHLQFSDVMNIYTGSSLDWLSAQNELQGDPLSAMVQSLGWATGDPQDSDISGLGPAVLLGSAIADNQSFSFGGPDAGAGALAVQLANMAMA